MKVRIKFSKEGPMKFVGHLDTMRYFQKAIRRANLPVAFSGGFSPHMIMSLQHHLVLVLRVWVSTLIWSWQRQFLPQRSHDVWMQ